MCYNAKYLLERQLKYAERHGFIDDAEKLKEKIRKLDEMNNYPHINAFAFPKLVCIDMDKQLSLKRWGLIPKHMRNWEEAKKRRTMTINARSETMFQKESFRNPARTSRCLILVDGFYEYHHLKSKNYPFFISRKDSEVMVFAGLCDDWVDQETGEVISTCSIVTTKPHGFMTRLHNNPKKNESRIPVILEESNILEWLQIINEQEEDELIQSIMALCISNEDHLTFHTVRKLVGKDSYGHTELASEPFEYPIEFEFEN